MLGPQAGGYESLEQHTSIEASIRPMNDGPGVDSAALHHSPEEFKAFGFLTYMFLSHLYSLISSAQLYTANLDG